MKTPEEIIAKRLGEGFSERRPASHGIITDCMKEYAKLWVTIAVALAGVDRGVNKNESTINLINSKIDAQ